MKLLYKKKYTTIKRSARKFIQRGNRGWSDEDAWSFDHYLAKVIIGGLTQLRDNNHGYPSDMTPESWEEALTTMIDGFEAAVDIIEMNFVFADPKSYNDLETRFDIGSNLFTANFFSLWD